MGDLWTPNGGFETDDMWALDGLAEYSDADQHGGARCLRLGAHFGTGPDYGSALASRPAIPGATYAVSAWIRNDEAEIGGGIVFSVHAVYYDGAVRNVIGSRAEGIGDPSTWFLLDFGDFVAVDPTQVAGFDVSATSGFTLGTRWWKIDDAQAVTQSEDVAKSTQGVFLANLKTALASIDPNIGVFLSTRRRHLTMGDIEKAASHRIAAAGLFDDADRVGRDVLRMWLCEAQIITRAFTNCSAEYEHRVTLTGFWNFEEGDEQGDALGVAAVEILDKLNTETVELQDLATGAGYSGFLAERPRMLNPVHPAALKNGTQGHAVQLLVTYFEEVAT